MIAGVPTEGNWTKYLPWALGFLLVLIVAGWIFDRSSFKQTISLQKNKIDILDKSFTQAQEWERTQSETIKSLNEQVRIAKSLNKASRDFDPTTGNLTHEETSVSQENLETLRQLDEAKKASDERADYWHEQANVLQQKLDVAYAKDTERNDDLVVDGGAEYRVDSKEVAIGAGLSKPIFKIFGISVNIRAGVSGTVPSK